MMNRKPLKKHYTNTNPIKAVDIVHNDSRCFM